MTINSIKEAISTKDTTTLLNFLSLITEGLHQIIRVDSQNTQDPHGFLQGEADPDLKKRVTVLTLDYMKRHKENGKLQFLNSILVPALSRHVLLESIQDPKNDTEVDLAKAYSSLPLIKGYVKALEEEVFKRLSDGMQVKGYQLVEGRKGNRTFKDPEKATEYLMNVLGDKAFKKILLSPKEVEQFHKEEIISDELWDELQELITRGDGKPIIAPRDIPPTQQNQKAQLNDFTALTRKETNYAID